jgi:predicted ABC-type ATPase
LQQPHLIIIAGCNGAGKSTYSNSIVEPIIPFDYDKRFLQIAETLPDSELKEEIARNKTTDELTTLIENAFQNKVSFCFETNLHIFPLNWIKKAKENGFVIDMHFFCLENVELAKKRVEIRAKNNGHFVEDDVINFKWKEGYKNLNLFFTEFDYISFIDNSNEKSIPQFMFELEKTEEENYKLTRFLDNLPEYIERRFPTIFQYLI